MLASLQRMVLSRALLAAAAISHRATRSILSRRSFRRAASFAQLNDHVLRDIGLERSAAWAATRGRGEREPTDAT